MIQLFFLLFMMEDVQLYVEYLILRIKQNSWKMVQAQPVKHFDSIDTIIYPAKVNVPIDIGY